MTTNPQTDRIAAAGRRIAEAEEAGPEDILVDVVALLREAATLYDAREQPESAGMLRRLARSLEPGAAVPAAGRVVSAAPTQTDEARRERYAVAIHDAMEADLSLVDQEPAVQALFARAAEAAVALADAELAARRAADLRDAEEICDEAGASYTAKALNEQADGAYELMARFRRKAEEAERTAAAVPAVPVPPTAHADRAAVLLEAADALPEADLPLVPPMDRRRVADWLRRLAAEAQQQPDTETRTTAALQQEVKRLGLMVDEYGRGASALTDKLKRARDMHRETCILARGHVPPTAFTCSMCEALDPPAMPVQQQPAVVAEQPAAADNGEEAGA